MAIAVELSFHGQGATIDNYFTAIEKMGAAPGGPHPDPHLLFHWVTVVGGGFVVTDVWQTREAFDQFAANRIGPISAEVGIPNPQTKFIEVANFLTAGG
jgi:hypothetical protein